MKATRSLPLDYKLYSKVSLQGNPGLLVLLSVLSVGLAGVFTWAFIHLLQLLRTDTAAIASQFYTTTSNGGFAITFHASSLLAIIAAILLIAPVHEAVHGIFFWLFTGQRPKFAYKVIYAYAAAPDWYLPRSPYLVIGIAPFVLLTVLGIALMPMIPNALIPALLLFMVFNAAGAVGDIAACLWLLFQPAHVLARDAGDVLTLYRHA